MFFISKENQSDRKIMNFRDKILTTSLNVYFKEEHNFRQRRIIFNERK